MDDFDELWEAARQRGWVETDPKDPKKEIIHADRNDLLNEIKRIRSQDK